MASMDDVVLLSLRRTTRLATLVTLCLLAGCARASLLPGAATVPAAAGVVHLQAGESLSGRILGPAAGLIAANAAGVISNQGALQRASGGQSYQLTALTALPAPIAGADVAAFDVQGHQISKLVHTDADGHYQLTGLAATASLVFVNATYMQASQRVTLSGLLRSSTAGSATLDLTAGTTLVSKKVQVMLQLGLATAESVDAAGLARSAESLDAQATAQTVVSAALLPPAQAAQTFDTLSPSAGPSAAAQPALNRETAQQLDAASQTVSEPLPDSAHDPVEPAAQDAAASGTPPAGVDPGATDTPGAADHPATSPAPAASAGGDDGSGHAAAAHNDPWPQASPSAQPSSWPQARPSDPAQSHGSPSDASHDNSHQGGQPGNGSSHDGGSHGNSGDAQGSSHSNGDQTKGHGG